MVQRDQWDTYWGVKNVFFLIRDIDDATMDGCVDGILSVRGPAVSLGSLRVETGRV